MVHYGGLCATFKDSSTHSLCSLAARLLSLIYYIEDLSPCFLSVCWEKSAFIYYEVCGVPFSAKNSLMLATVLLLPWEATGCIHLNLHFTLFVLLIQVTTWSSFLNHSGLDTFIVLLLGLRSSFAPKC